MSVHESTGAYVLDALPPDERREFEAHLEGCEACRREVEQLRVAADALPVGVTQYAPPPALKERLMAQVAAPAAPPARARSRRPQWFGWRSALALACAALIGIGIGRALSGDDVQRLQASVAPAGARVSLEMRDDESTLIARDLPAPPQGRVYQVWLKRRGVEAPEPTDALFTPRDGRAEVDVTGDLGDVEAVLVTHEPPGGSRAPTVAPLISITT
jgi:anti-sigma factor RsiW